MTTSPNKMSEEIRKQLVKSLSIAQVESVDDNGEAVIEYEADRLLKLITADRKRVALEARIDELENNKWLRTSEELDLYRALQTLKDRDGNYILSTISFASQYGLQGIIEFIDARLQAYTDEIRREVIGGDETVNDIENPSWDEFRGRNFMRRQAAALGKNQLKALQRQALNNLATKWGMK